MPRIFSIRIAKGTWEAILRPELMLLLKMIAAHSNGIAVTPAIENSMAKLGELGVQIERSQQPDGDEIAVLMSSGADLDFDYTDVEPSNLANLW